MSEDKLTKNQLELRKKYGVEYKGRAYKNLDRYVIDNFDTTSVVQMSKDIGVGRSTIQNVYRSLGMNKFDTFQGLESGEVVVSLTGDWKAYDFTSKGRMVNRETQIIKKPFHKLGYLRYEICIDGVYISTSQHRLLALNFIHNTDTKTKLVVNHKNGVRDDNRLSNLEWVTSQENSQHAIKVLKRPKTYGETSNLSSISEDQALELIHSINMGMRNPAILKVHDYATKGILDALRYKGSWGHLDKYKEW